MVAHKGKSDIGDQINKKILGPLAAANELSDMPDFADATKLGSGKELVDRLTNLIAIFENRALDFSKNRADGDDILGDAYASEPERPCSRRRSQRATSPTGNDPSAPSATSLGLEVAPHPAASIELTRCDWAAR